jgi:hypothetical protein
MFFDVMYTRLRIHCVCPLGRVSKIEEGRIQRVDERRGGDGKPLRNNQIERAFFSFHSIR